LPLSNLGELTDQFPTAAVEIIRDGLALGVKAEARLALLLRRDAVISDKLSSRFSLPSRA
jgi:hypothetical protein